MKYDKSDFQVVAVGPYEVWSRFKSFAVGTPGESSAVEVHRGDRRLAWAQWPGLNGAHNDGFRSVEAAQAAYRLQEGATVDELEALLAEHVLQK